MFAAMPPQRCAAAGALVLIALAAQPVPLVASGGCPGPSAACQVSAEDEAGAALGLLQFSSHDASSYRGGAGAGVGTSAGEVASEVGGLGAEEARLLRSRLASRGLGGAGEALPGMNCTLHPSLCQAPFNCQNPPTLQEIRTWMTVRLATEDGHANPRSWCMPGILDYVGGNAYDDGPAMCIKDHDLKGYADHVYNLSVEDGTDGVDASYCFLEGHCTNTDVTYDTTLEEADAACDAKYGRERWTSVSLATVDKTMMFHPFAMSPTYGFTKSAVSDTFGMLGCAMGNFHCDVFYCKDKYCKDPHYVEKYGHLLKE